MSDSKHLNFIPGDDATPADAITHSLLEQAAANHKGADEDFLDRVEAAIDAEEEAVVAIPIRPAKEAPRPWKTLSWSAVAAMVLLSGGAAFAFYYVTSGSMSLGHSDQVLVHSANSDDLDIDSLTVRRATQGPSSASSPPGDLVAQKGMIGTNLRDSDFSTITDYVDSRPVTDASSHLSDITIASSDLTSVSGVSGDRDGLTSEPGESSLLANSDSDGVMRSRGVGKLNGTVALGTGGEVIVHSAGARIVKPDEGNSNQLRPVNTDGIVVNAGNTISIGGGFQGKDQSVVESLKKSELSTLDRRYLQVGNGGVDASGLKSVGDEISVTVTGSGGTVAMDPVVIENHIRTSDSGAINLATGQAWFDGGDAAVPPGSVAQAGRGGAGEEQRGSSRRILPLTKKRQQPTVAPSLGYTGADIEIEGKPSTSVSFGRVSGPSDPSKWAQVGGKYDRQVDLLASELSKDGEDVLHGGGSLSVDFGFVAENPVTESKSTRYNELIDNEWMSPREEPLSTFSSDVDTASWTNLRGMIRSGLSIGQIPNDAVRIEEMINYFDWDYSKPKGDHPFSFATETASCPWNADHQLLRVGVQGMEISKKKRPNSNLVFLIDVSGSMDRSNKLGLVKKSIMVLAEELRETDCVSMVVYAGAEGLALPATSGRDTAAIANALTRLNAGGSTNGGAGIKLAYQMAKENFIEGGVNRVILCTDGDFNVGITGNESLVKMVENRAKEGVFLSVLGYGNDNLNDSMLEEITNKGNGNYFFIDSLAEARKVLLRDLMGTLVAIAKDVKIQIEFNPAKVDGYRLIGYANRKLKAEDFANDKVDAGEVGSGHSVTALYEIIPAGMGMKGVGELRYQKASKPKPELELVESRELALLKLRYKRPDSDVSTPIEQVIVPVDTKWEKASGDFRFASAVSLFGLILRDHESAREASLDDVVRLAESGKGNDPLGYRSEFIDLVKILKAAKN